MRTTCETESIIKITLNFILERFIFLFNHYTAVPQQLPYFKFNIIVRLVSAKIAILQIFYKYFTNK
jgi:hypothetical protein